MKKSFMLLSFVLCGVLLFANVSFAASVSARTELPMVSLPADFAYNGIYDLVSDMPSSGVQVGEYDCAPFNSQYKCYGDQLNAANRVMYNTLCSIQPGATGETTVAIPHVYTNAEYSSLNIQAVAEAFYLDTPETFWFTTFGYSGYSDASGVHLNIVYTPDTTNYPNAVSLNTQMWDMVKNKDFLSAKNRYLLVKGIHDYLAQKITYTDTGLDRCHDPVGALVDSKCVCQGYAEAFKMFCDYYKIPCVCVIGTGVTSGGSGNHMWNAVKMDDGIWYLLDNTWDDQGSYGTLYDFFLVGTTTIDTHFTKVAFSASHVTAASEGFQNSLILNYPPFSTAVYAGTAQTQTRFAATNNCNADTVHKVLYSSLTNVNAIYCNGLYLKLANAFTGGTFTAQTGSSFANETWVLALYGDVNGDGICNSGDYSAVVSGALSQKTVTSSSSNADKLSDANGDGVVDAIDAEIYALASAGHDIFSHKF